MSSSCEVETQMYVKLLSAYITRVYDLDPEGHYQEWVCKMKIVLSRDIQETLWGFARLGLSVSIIPHCPKCKKWGRLITVPNKELKYIKQGV